MPSACLCDDVGGIRHFLCAQPTAQCLCISEDCSILSWSGRPAVCGTRPPRPRILWHQSTVAWREPAARDWSWNWTHTHINTHIHTAEIQLFLFIRLKLDDLHVVFIMLIRKSGALTLLAEDGWGLVLAVWLGRRRCLDASGRFPAVQIEENRPRYVRTNARIQNNTRHPNSTPRGCKCLSPTLFT